MQWDDDGFLLSKNKYNENSVIAEVFTKERGKISAIIFGASSKKIKNYLEIGNKLHVNHNSKNENKIGYFKIEILKPLTPLFFDNQQKLMCINSALNLIRLLTVEAQSNIKIYHLIDNFFEILKKDNWLKEYIFWELKFLKVIGYDLELKNIAKKELIDNKIIYFVKTNFGKKIIPNFL